MSDDKKRLPFLLYDAMLDAMSQSVHGATAMAKSMIAVPPGALHQGVSPARTSGQPSEKDGGASTAALAAALDENARAGLENYEERTAAKGAANIDALTVDAPDTQPKPERKAGPKPFTPQVGP